MTPRAARDQVRVQRARAEQATTLAWRGSRAIAGRVVATSPWAWVAAGLAAGVAVGWWQGRAPRAALPWRALTRAWSWWTLFGAVDRSDNPRSSATTDRTAES
jgi:hypothetical protein